MFRTGVPRQKQSSKLQNGRDDSVPRQYLQEVLSAAAKLNSHPSLHNPDDWRAGNCIYLFMFGLLGPIKEGEDSGGENHLEPREQPGRPRPAQTDLGFQGRPASPPPRTAAQRKGTAAAQT